MPAEIHRKELKTLVSQGRAQLIDVSAAVDYSREHLPKAVNIPLGRFREGARQLRKDEAVIVYSEDYRCDLSARAAWQLESMGFHEVYRYTPGKADWRAAGYPTEGTHPAKKNLLKLSVTNVPVCGLRDRLRQVKNRYIPDQDDVCVVINDRNVVLGLVYGEAWNADPLALIADVMDTSPQTFRPDQSPAEVLKEMRKHGFSTALLTTSDGELLGLLTRNRKTQRRHQAA
jgi:rhodanese-related sulfurtransferase